MVNIVWVTCSRELHSRTVILAPQPKFKKYSFHGVDLEISWQGHPYRNGVVTICNALTRSQARPLKRQQGYW